MVNKKLAKHNSQELQIISQTLGAHADIQILLTFFQDIDFTEQRQKDTYKVQYLSQQLSNLSTKP